MNILAPLDLYISPLDSDLDKLIAESIDLVDVSNKNCSIRSMTYAFDSTVILTALENAYNRKINIEGILDKTQYGGEEEQIALSKYFNIVPKNLYTIGTSEKKDQIIHTKMIWLNWNENSQVLPDKEFDDWKEAIKAGYPVLFEGSLNLSNSAPVQVNSLLVIVGFDPVIKVQNNFNALKQWNLIHQRSG